MLKMYKSLLASQVQVNKSHQVAFGGKGSHLAGREQRFGFDWSPRFSGNAVVVSNWRSSVRISSSPPSSRSTSTSTPATNDTSGFAISPDPFNGSSNGSSSGWPEPTESETRSGSVKMCLGAGNFLTSFVVPESQKCETSRIRRIESLWGFIPNSGLGGLSGLFRFLPRDTWPWVHHLVSRQVRCNLKLRKNRKTIKHTSL